MHSSHLIQVLVTSNHQLYPLDTTQSWSYNIEMPPAQHYPGYSYSYFRSQVVLFFPTLWPQNPSLAFLIRLSSELLILQWQLWFFLSLLEVGVGWFSGKESARLCGKQRRCGLDPWIRKINWRQQWEPTPVFSLGEFHGQRNLVVIWAPYFAMKLIFSYNFYCGIINI